MIVKDALNMNVWLKLARIVDLSHILAKECRFDFFLAYYRIYIIELYQICFRTFSKNADPCCPSPLYQGICFVCLDTRVVSGWDHEISHGHHVVSHGQIVAAGSSCIFSFFIKFWKRSSRRKCQHNQDKKYLKYLY